MRSIFRARLGRRSRLHLCVGFLMALAVTATASAAPSDAPASAPAIARIHGGATKTVWGVGLGGETQFLATTIKADLEAVKAAIQAPGYQAAAWLPSAPTAGAKALPVLDRDAAGRVAAVVAGPILSGIGNWDAQAGPDVLWAKNSQGISKPHLLRTALPWWVYPAQAAAGEPVRLFGRNLRPTGEKNFTGLFALVSPRGATTRFLQPLRSGRHPMYEQELVLPADLEPGEVHLYFFNGTGGAAGWGGPVTLTVVPARTSDAPRIAVVSPATGADATDLIQNALDRAAANGATVRLGTGIYSISRTLSVPEGVSLEGAGRHATTLRPGPGGMTTDFPAETGGAKFEGYARDWIPHMRGRGYAPLIWVRSNSAIADLRLEQDGTSGIGILVARAPGVAERVRITRVAGQAFESTRSWVPSAAVRTTGDTLDLSIVDCSFEGRGAIEINGAMNRGLQIARCRLSGLPEGKYNLMFVRGAMEGVIEDNQIRGGMRAIVFQDARHFGRDEVPDGMKNSGAGILHLFIAGNVLEDSVPRRHNDGENMFESNDHFWAGSPSEVMADGFRVAEGPFNAVLNGNHVLVCDGDGLGEFRRIVAHTKDRIVFDRPWSVPPTTKSVLKVGAFSARSLWIDNRESHIAGPLMFWGACVENVVDGHIQHAGGGFVFWDPKTEYPMPVAFNDLINSRFIGRGNIRLLGPMVFGNTVRCNEVIDFHYQPNYHVMQSWLAQAAAGSPQPEVREGWPRYDVGLEILALPFDRKLQMPYLSSDAPVSAWNVIEWNHIRGEGTGVRLPGERPHNIVRNNAVSVTGKSMVIVPASAGAK